MVAVSRELYTLLICALVVERAVELLISRRNERWLCERGAVEEGADHYPWMVTLHALFPLACLVEVWGLDRPWIPYLGWSMLVLLVLCMAGRYWVVATLGRRWTTRVLVLPESTPIRHGPYRGLRHPNYLVVVLEFLAVPLIHTAWATAAVFGVANLVLVRRRIEVEERALGYERSDE